MNQAKKIARKFLLKRLTEIINLLNDILLTAKPETLLCIGVDITSANESIQTKKIKDWKKISLIYISGLQYFYCMQVIIIEYFLALKMVVVLSSQPMILRLTELLKNYQALNQFFHHH